MATSDPISDSVDKQLSLAHLNINGLRNNIHDIHHILTCHQIHVLALSETKLDFSVYNTELNIRGYSLYRRDRNSGGGGVALYVQSQIPVKLRPAFMLPELEIVWVQILLPNDKLVLVGCCYRPANIKKAYLDKICETIDMVSREGKDIFLLGDFNIDWLSKNISFKGLTQVIQEATRVTVKDGKKTSTCIDHIYTNVPRNQCNPSSIVTGCSDHNIVHVTVRRDVPKVRQEIIIQRSSKDFDEQRYKNDIEKIQWMDVYKESKPELALSKFIQILNKSNHDDAKEKDKIRYASWVDDELKSLMSQRDAEKEKAIKDDALTLDCQNHWGLWKMLRDEVSKMSTDKRRKYFQQKLIEAKNDAKKVQEIVKECLGQNSILISPVITIESERRLITEAAKIAKYLNNYYINEIRQLQPGQFDHKGLSLPCSLIKERIMKNKKWELQFEEVDVGWVESVLSSLPEDMSPGLDNMDLRRLKTVVEHISDPICYILNRCVLRGEFPSLWKKARVIPVPKNFNANFSAENSRAVSLLPVLGQILEKLILKQIQEYFIKNELFTQHQCAYRKDDCTWTPLENVIKKWYKDFDSNKLVGATFLYLSASSDLISHDLLLKKLEFMVFQRQLVL